MNRIFALLVAATALPVLAVVALLGGAEVADRLVKAGQPPRVLTAAAIVGAARAGELFEQAYDEHARRVARLYAELGQPRT